MRKLSEGLFLCGYNAEEFPFTCHPRENFDFTEFLADQMLEDTSRFGLGSPLEAFSI